MKQLQKFFTFFALLVTLLASLLSTTPAYAATGATFVISGSNLNLDLKAGVSATIATSGTTYTLILNGANTWSGTDGSGVTGNGLGTLSVLSSGSYTTINITDSGTGASVIFTDGGGLTYTKSFNVTLDNGSGTVTINGSTNIPSSGSTFTVTAPTINMNGSVITFDSAQTYNGAITLGANALPTGIIGGNLTFNGTINGAYSLQAITSGTTTFNGAIGNITPLSGLQVTTGAAVFNIASAASVATFGNQVYQGPVTLSNNLTLDADDGNISFASTIDGAHALSLNHSGTMTFSGQVGGTTALTSLQADDSGTIDINGGLMRTTGLQSYLGNIVLNAASNATTLQSTGAGAITLGINHFVSLSSLTLGEESLTVTTTGITTINALVGISGPALKDLSVTSGPTYFGVDSSITTQGTQTYSGAVVFADSANPFLMSGGEINFSGGAGSVGGTGALTLMPYDPTAAVTVGESADTGPTVLDITDSDINAIDGMGSLTIGSPTTGSGAVTVVSASFLLYPVTITGGSISVTGLDNGSYPVTLTANTGAITDGGIGTDVTASALALQAATGITTLADPLDTVVSSLEAQSVTGGVFVSNTGNLTVGGVSSSLTGIRTTGSGNVNLDTTGTITFSEAPFAGSGGSVTIISFSSGAITFNTTINGAFALVVNTNGTTTFNNAIGNTTPLTSLSTVFAGGHIKIYGGVVSTSGAQSYQGLDLSFGAVATTLTGSEIDFNSPTWSVSGSNALTLAPASASANIAIGQATDTGAAVLDITDPDIAALANGGFSSITIGAAANGSGAVTVNSSTFTAPVTIVGGSVSVTDLSAGSNPVTLTARTGAITDGGDTATDVTAPSLALSAASGIGGSGTAATLETSVSNLEAQSDTGGVFVSNSSDLTIGGASGNLTGARTTTSGNVAISAVGTLTLSEDSITSGTGTFSLTATKDIISTGTITTQGGAITLNARSDANPFGGAISVEAAINSNGGAIVLGGGINPLTTSTYGWGSLSNGIQVINSGSISSGAGAISLRGGGRNSAGTSSYGLLLLNNIISTSGNITLAGQGGDSAPNTQGNGLYVSGTISSTSGNITVTGTGGNGANTGHYGVHVNNGGIFQVNSGNLSITGTGFASASPSLYLDGGSLLSTGPGTITITARTPLLVGTLDDLSSVNDSNVIGGPSDSGDITFITDGINFSNGSVQSSGNFTIKPVADTGPISIGVGGGAGTVNLSDAELALLADGFNSITIGDATAGTGAVDVDSSTFTDPINIMGSSIAVTELNAGSNPATLTATSGAISDGGDTGTDVTASTLGLSAVSGIGAGNPLETTVNNLEAETATGGVFVSNSGDLTIGGASAGLTGVRTTTSGNVALTTSGAITISEDSITSGTGTFSLTATDSITNTGTITTQGGAITLNSDSDASGAGAVSVEAAINSNGGNIVLGGGADPLTTPAYGSGILTNGVQVISSGSLSSGAGAISLRGIGEDNAASNGGQGLLVTKNITSTSGNITLWGQGGDSAPNKYGNGLYANGTTISSTSGDITVTGTAGGVTTGHYGVHLNNGGIFQVNSGHLSVTAIGDTAAFYLEEGKVLSTGPGDITITSTGTAQDIASYNNSANVIGGPSDSGDITLITDRINLQNCSIQSSGNFVIKPVTASASIALGGASGTLNLSDSELGFLADGFNSLTFGDVTNGTGTVTIISSTYTDPVTIVGGSISVTGINAGSNPVTLTARTATISDGGDTDTDIIAGALTLNAVGLIGNAGNELLFAVDSLSSSNNANQFIREADSLTWNTSTSGSMGFNLMGGQFNVGSGQVITTGGVSAGNGVTVGGVGTITTLLAGQNGGTIAPGNSLGILHIGSAMFNAGSTFSVEVNDVTTAGTDYDQLDVTGTVTIASTAHLVTSGTVSGATTGATLVIINNDGADPVSGTFNGLPDGAVVIINGDHFRIFYNGGDGNDVVLVADNTPPTVTINQGSSQSDPTNASPIVFDVTFSETVTGFDSSDVNVSGLAGTPNVSVLGSGASYTVEVTGMADGETVSASIPANAAQDLAGNNSAASTSSDNSVTFDSSAPNITINNPDTSPATSKTITASTSDGTLTMSNTTGSICDNSLTFVAYTSQTFTSELDNGTKVCYQAADAAGNTSYSLSDAIAGIDATAPTVTIEQASAQDDPTNVSPIHFTVTFSEAVTGFDETDVDLSASTATGTLVASVSGGPTVYDVTVSGMSGDGDVIASIPSGAAQDAALNDSEASSSSDHSIAFDTTAPTVDSFAAASPASLDIPITDFTASDANGVAGYLITETSTPPLASNSGWTVAAPTTYTVSSGGSYTLYPWAKDAAGNVSDVYGSPASVTVDAIAPTVDSFAATSPSNSLDIPITDFTASDASGVGGYLITKSSTPPDAGDSGWTISHPTTYTVASDGSYTLYPWAKDTAGNVSAVYGAPVSVVVDSAAPTFISSTRANANPTGAASVGFIVTFSEAVTGVDTADFSLTTTGISGASVASVTGSGATRIVTVNTGSGSGIIRLTIPNTATITDLNNNALTGLPYTSGQAYNKTTTVTFISAATNDGWLLESSETSSKGGALNSGAGIFRLGDDATRKQYRGLLSFSTVSIPDNAVITSVTLKVKRQAVVGGGNPISIFQGFLVDIKKGFFGTAALQTSDFQAAANRTYGPFKPGLIGGWYSINLTSGQAYINKLSTSRGLTQIRLRFKLDDNNNAIANYLSLYSGNAPVSSRPQLVITYYVP